MNFISLFAGIGGFDLGFERAGLQCIAQVEKDPFCRAVLAKHWPDVPKLEDVRDAGKHNLPFVDLVVFGSPCQDLSTAGKRNGLKGKRSGLFHEAIRIIGELGPTFAVWENVPGAFSSNSGRDFAAILAAFRECGARDIAWRTFDSQYFGVPQQRRRIFLVADFRGERAAEILFEREGGAGSTKASTEARARVATITERSFKRCGGFGWTEREFVTGTLESNENGHEIMNGKPHVISVFNWQSGGDVRLSISSKNTGSLQANQVPAVHSRAGVRRLTPREFERLQGFPDDWTRYGADGSELADTHRYRMLGNAVTVPVTEWIGRRIIEVERDHGK